MSDAEPTLVAGEVEGWKVLDVRQEDDLELLWSPRGQVWPPYRFTLAVCDSRRTVYRRNETGTPLIVQVDDKKFVELPYEVLQARELKHESPAEWCSCGIYVATDPRQCIGYLTRPGRLMVRVALSGLIVPGQRGYRGQKARVVGLTTAGMEVGTPQLKALSRLYDVPIEGGPEVEALTPEGQIALRMVGLKAHLGPWAMQPKDTDEALRKLIQTMDAAVDQAVLTGLRKMIEGPEVGTPIATSVRGGGTTAPRGGGHEGPSVVHERRQRQREQLAQLHQADARRRGRR